MKAHECYHCKQWVEEGEAHDCWTTTEAALTSDLAADLQDAYARIRLYHGPLVLRLDVSEAGAVASCRVLVDRVTAVDGGDSDWEGLRERLVKAMAALRFTEAKGPTAITQPVLLGVSLFR